MEIYPFQEIASLAPGESVESQLSIKFPSVSHAAKFEVWYALVNCILANSVSSTDQGTFNITLSPSIGDLVRASPVSTGEFAELESEYLVYNIQIFSLIHYRNS